MLAAAADDDDDDDGKNDDGEIDDDGHDFHGNGGGLVMAAFDLMTCVRLWIVMIPPQQTMKRRLDEEQK